MECGADYEQAVGDVVTGLWVNSLRWAALSSAAGPYERAILQRGCLVHGHGGVEIAVELSRVALVR